MKNFLLKFKFFYRLYQKLIRKNQDDYKFIKYVFSQNEKVNILDLCCGDSYVLNYINDDNTIWEQHSLPKLAEDDQIQAYKHEGFWYPMDTIRDKEYLEELWNKKNCPWKSWDE